MGYRVWDAVFSEKAQKAPAISFVDCEFAVSVWLLLATV